MVELDAITRLEAITVDKKVLIISSVENNSSMLN